MTDAERDEWKKKLTLVRLKQGRTLTTAIVHVEGAAEPPLEVLLLAAANWTRLVPGQAVRRPDESGKQVYWVNILTSDP